jgi:hypothetical protein
MYLLCLLFIARRLTAPFVDRSKSRTKKLPLPDTSGLFHKFQIAAVGSAFVVAFLTGHSHSTRLVWVALVFEVIVGFFYLAYIGFSMALRYLPPKTIYAGFIWVLLCGWYSCRMMAN